MRGKRKEGKEKIKETDAKKLENTKGRPLDTGRRKREAGKGKKESN